MSEEFGRRTRLRQLRWRLYLRHPFCAYCRRPVTWKRSTLDHRLPIVLGGTDDEANLCLSCEACNASKGPRDVLGWAADLVEAAGVVA